MDQNSQVKEEDGKLLSSKTIQECNKELKASDLFAIEDFSDDEREVSTKFASLAKYDAEEAAKLTLENEWVFWYDDQGGVRQGMDTEDYEKSIKNIGQFSTVQVTSSYNNYNSILNALQDFWRYSNSLIHVSMLPDGTNLRMFKFGIMPTWEDPANVQGGRWVFW